MECFAGIVGGLGAKTFEYNRDNFLFDRELRLRKEFAVQKFRIKQAELWREDVRDLISLTEYKMHVYLLVNVLLISFTVILWCEGRLPPDTPSWLMMGNQIAIGGGFMFLLLSVWLAMHAAVAAQSYETRLLTQLARLPIPTWQEIEACRTYASQFEEQQKKQILRVPFILRNGQESLVETQPTDEDTMASRDADAPAQTGISSAVGSQIEDDGIGDGEMDAPADPWGHERTGDYIYELGCPHGAEIAKLRHIKLTHQAMVYWQSYDAYSRISMSVGVQQILLAMSYYILGYVLVQVGARSSATYGMVILTLLSEVLAKLDMSLSMWQLRQLQFCLAAGPAASCAAAYLWSFSSTDNSRAAEACTIAAFILHGCHIALLIRFCCIEDNGTLLPTAFRSVLYLDVFSHRKRDDEWQPTPRFSGETMSAPRNMDAETSAVPLDTEDAPSEQPALKCMTYNGSRTIPSRPEDQAPRVAPDGDMRKIPGAPQPGGKQNDAFYDAAHWMPGDTFSESEQEATENDIRSIATGHESEQPKVLPWRVFCTFAVVLGIAWLLAAIYHAVSFAAKSYNFDIPSPILEPNEWEDKHPRHLAELWPMDETGSWNSSAPIELEKSNSPTAATSLLGIFTGGAPAVAVRPENVSLSWPHSNVLPTSLSCDATGHHFLVTDGLLMYSAELATGHPEELSLAYASESAKMRRVLRQQRNAADSTPTARFEEVSCPGLLGEGLQDVAVSCPGGTGKHADCEALVLHGQGRRIRNCPFTQGAIGNGGWISTAAISDTWLERMRGPRSVDGQAGSQASIEKAVTITTDSSCKGGGSNAIRQGCTLVGTTHGRVVQLRQHMKREELVPGAILRDRGNTGDGLAAPGTVRSLNSRYLGVLQTDEGQQSLLVFDNDRGGTLARQLRLPPEQTASAFCAGGGHIYLLGSGPSPTMWRTPVPLGFQPDAKPLEHM